MSRSKRTVPATRVAAMGEQLAELDQQMENRRQEELVARLEDAADTVAGAVNKLVKVLNTTKSRRR